MFFLRDLATCSITTSALSSGGVSPFVDDCSAFPQTTEILGQGMCLAIIEDGGVTQTIPEIVRLSGRIGTTLLSIAERGFAGTTQPASWPIGSNITIINTSELWNMLGTMYMGYALRVSTASPGAVGNPGPEQCRFHGSATPSLCTDFAINDTVEEGWDIGPFLSQFAAGDLVRIKYMAIGNAASGSPKFPIVPYARVEFKIDTGGWTDNTGYWSCPIDSTYFTISGEITDDSDGISGFAIIDLVKLV